MRSNGGGGRVTGSPTHFPLLLTARYLKCVLNFVHVWPIGGSLRGSYHLRNGSRRGIPSYNTLNKSWPRLQTGTSFGILLEPGSNVLPPCCFPPEEFADLANGPSHSFPILGPMESSPITDRLPG